MLPSKKAVQAALKEAVFDPRKPGHLSIIVEDADADYVTERAMEFLRLTRLGGDVESQIRDAMSLLAYGQVLRQQTAARTHVIQMPAPNGG